ncbi:winged helix-turn-helix domain-containing protein [Pseudoalteromonas sp. YIC-656]|uniref:winged helix-turn-helix domain-containing protein n=1 Tax=Pseudoalteromonas pernae TaxID=3118054 RepID=UPI003242CA1E
MSLTNHTTRNDFIIEDVRFMPSQSLLEKDGKQVKLTAKATELLLLFLSSKDNLVDFNHAISSIWNDNEEVGKKGFTNAVWMLRKGFKEVGLERDIFESIPKVGYRFIAKYTEQPNAKRLAGFELRFVVAGVLLIGVLCLFYFLFLNNQTNQWQNTAVHGLTRSTNYEGVEEFPSISNSGQYLAFSWIQEGEFSQIYIKDLLNADTPLRLISAGKGKEVSPAWSPNDNYIAYARINEQGACDVIRNDILLDQEATLVEDCYYLPYRRVIEWSDISPNRLIYSKQLQDRVALFEYNIDSEKQHQITFPEVGQIDFSPRVLGEKVYFVRDTHSPLGSIIKVTNGDQTSSRIGRDISGVLSLDVDKTSHTLVATHNEGSQFKVTALDMHGATRTQLSAGKLSSNLDYSVIHNSVFAVEHISKEYVAMLDLSSGRELDTVSSSSRDIYGEYDAVTQAFVFLSNRDERWGVWKKGARQSVNITEKYGEASIPRIHHGTGKILVKISESKDAGLYVFANDTHHVISDIEPEVYGWSSDSNTIYYSATHSEGLGILSYHIPSGKLVPMTNTGEAYAQDLDEHTVVMSRFNENGLWLFDKRNGEMSLLTRELDKSDFGAFYASAGDIYFLKRTKTEDQIVKISDYLSTVVQRFPANSIRKFYGIAKGEGNTAIVTFKLANQADIYQYRVQ